MMPASSIQLENSKSIEVLCQQARQDALTSIYHAQSGHPGGVLSCIDILTVLFHQILAPANIRQDSYSDDYFVLSKGHAAPALYAVAATRGLLERESLASLRKINSPLQGHPDVSHLPWVEVSTGSLGQGVSTACGIAKALQLKKSKQRVYSLIGDGELQEGQVWEVAMFAAHHKLDNFTVIVDYNKLQSDARNETICGLEPLLEKWQAFGWHCQEIDGHDENKIFGALVAAKQAKNSPQLILAHTIKGKGVSFMEDFPTWHGSVALTDSQYEKAMKELRD